MVSHLLRRPRGGDATSATQGRRYFCAGLIENGPAIVSIAGPISCTQLAEAALRLVGAVVALAVDDVDLAGVGLAERVGQDGADGVVIAAVAVDVAQGRHAA